MNKTVFTYTIYIILSALACLVPALRGVAQPASQLVTFETPKYEVRAVWLTTIGGIDWPHSYANASAPEAIRKQKQELCNILDQLKRANVNTVLIQTRVRATTIYPSDMEPWDGCLSGKPGVSPGYDALQYAIDECHQRGMECHAWVVTIPIGKWNGAGCRQLRNRHPELVRKIGEDGYMNPEHPGTATYLARMCSEIASRYDIDGIHLDYIRYPETWKIGSRDLRNADQRRACITAIVQAVNVAVKQQKPWVKMSCSPIGKFRDLRRFSSHGWNAYSTVCQDAQGWLRDGLMDQLYPMMYFRNDQFFPFAADWAEQSYGRTVAPGLGIYFLDPKEGKWQLSDITREMHVLRQLGLGHTYFRSRFFTNDTKGIYRYVCNNVDLYPALVPPMTWYAVPKPAAPTQLKVEYGRQTTVTWTGATPYYNIYASREFPVDVEDVRNLVAQRVSAHSLAVEDDTPRFYAVTGMDRYGNESQPTQCFQADQSHQLLLKNDGTTLQLPTDGGEADAGCYIIETMQQVAYATCTPRGHTIDISQVPEGGYTLRSLNKKGVTHKLGHFIIKR